MSTVQDKPLADIIVEELMISSDIVAHVQIDNPVEHALLILVKSGYTAVPVVDSSFKLHGIIGKTAILNNILGLERFEMERLSKLSVADLMDTEIVRLKKNDSFGRGLDVMINNAFVCVENESGHFDGILTRRSVLKQLKSAYYQSQFS